jgi:hypothetical protein
MAWGFSNQLKTHSIFERRKKLPKNVICNILLNVYPKQEKPEIHMALKLIN